MEKPILTTIQMFSAAIAQIDAHKPGADVRLDLAVSAPGRYSNNKVPTVELSLRFYDGNNSQVVSGDNLDSLVAEALRRLGFADRAAMKMDAIRAGLTALPSPENNG